jgi:hypothetical protein
MTATLFCRVMDFAILVRDAAVPVRNSPQNTVPPDEKCASIVMVVVVLLKLNASNDGAFWRAPYPTDNSCTELGKLLIVLHASVIHGEINIVFLTKGLPHGTHGSLHPTQIAG